MRELDPYIVNDNYKNKSLKPARNVRVVRPRCCASCKHHESYDGFELCKRLDGYEGDTGDGEAFYHVCDLWTSHTIA
jgi:hypothetical protein